MWVKISCVLLSNGEEEGEQEIERKCEQWYLNGGRKQVQEKVKQVEMKSEENFFDE